MIIIAHKYGQLGNRLAYLRVYISFALEHNIKILDLSFDEYSKYFMGTCCNVLRINNILSRLLRNVITMLINLGLISNNNKLLSLVETDDNRHVRLIDSAIAEMCIENNVIIYDGWPIINWNLVKKHDSEIRSFFSLVDGIANKVKSFIEQVKEADEILVGVHIRQGDYKNWNSGKHYFNSTDYVRIMRKVLEMHPNSIVKFIISTNEHQDWGLFSEFNYVCAPGNAVEDMYILAECDEIYGPQSSFSGWASFFGDVPLRWIDNPDCFIKALDPMV